MTPCQTCHQLHDPWLWCPKRVIQPETGIPLTDLEGCDSLDVDERSVIRRRILGGRLLWAQDGGSAIDKVDGRETCDPNLGGPTYR